MADPQVYLSLDNCFATKRWSRPREWAKLFSELGVYYAEASADNECDPIYAGREFLKNWSSETREACGRYGIKTTNMYSGHGTYATLGLAHYDEKIRRRFIEDWVFPYIDTARVLDAGIGFFFHAFSEEVLDDHELYAAEYERLCFSLSEIAAYADGVSVALEQMYTPHQPPWRIDETSRLLERVSRLAGAPLYVTVDTGHQCGQRRYLRPTDEQIRGYLSGAEDNIWLGARGAYELAEKLKNNGGYSREAVMEIKESIRRSSHMFAYADDGDTYSWIARLGAFSPIIHLQQTDGCSSSHLCFTDENNKNGIIDGARVIEALKRSYAGAADDITGVPHCEKLYLTLEPFFSTAASARDITLSVAKSVEYWRRYIPTDGMLLSEL